MAGGYARAVAAPEEEDAGRRREGRAHDDDDEGEAVPAADAMDAAAASGDVEGAEDAEVDED